MADEADDTGFEPISSLTLAGLGKGMMNRARTQGEGIARQIAQNYQDLGDFGRSLVPRGVLGPVKGPGHSPLDPPSEPEMKESPFAANSSDQGVRVGAHLLDPANFVGLGGGALGVKALKQAATSRALRAAAEREALATQTAQRVAADPYAFLLRGGPSSQRGFMSPKLAGGLSVGGLGMYGASRLFSDDKPDDPAARTTGNAFQQQQEQMDAVREELRRQEQRNKPQGGGMQGTRG